MPLPPHITILPEPWRRPRLRAIFDGGPGPAASRRFRSELGLSTTAPIVISGHQAAIWHAGIVAKVFALDAIRTSDAAQPVWLVVDQDANDPFTLRLPIINDAGTLGEIPWILHPPGANPELPSSLRPAFDVLPAPDALASRPAFPAETQIARDITAHIAAHRAEPSAAAQISRAALDLALADRPQPALLLATAISRTTLFAELVERMQRDPGACIDAYNLAAQSCRVPGIGPLAADRGRSRYELPLWHIDRTEGARKRVFSHTLAGIPITDLAPKALFMTGLLRAASCELFIHGTGGGASATKGGYDKVTEQWMHAWLGWRLAPSTVVSATMRLPIGDTAPVTEEDVAAAAVNAHRALHTPAMLGDTPAADAKLRLLEVLKDRQAPRTHRRVAFSQMHDLLASARESHAPTLATINATVTDLRARHQRGRLAADRTWPFPLHGTERLGDLARALAAALA